MLISCDYERQKWIFLPLSGRCMPRLFKIVFTFEFHPLHAKIWTPTGTPVPDEELKELSSNVKNLAISSLGSWSTFCQWNMWNYTLGVSLYSGSCFHGRSLTTFFFHVGGGGGRRWSIFYGCKGLPPLYSCVHYSQNRQSIVLCHGPKEWIFGRVRHLALFFWAPIFFVNLCCNKAK